MSQQPSFFDCPHLKRCGDITYFRVRALNLATFSLASSSDSTMLLPPSKNSAMLGTNSTDKCLVLGFSDNMEKEDLEKAR